MRFLNIAAAVLLLACAETPHPEAPAPWLQLERFIADRQDCWIWIEPDTSFHGMVDRSTPVDGNLAPSGVDALRALFSDQMLQSYQTDALPVTDSNLQSGTQEVPIFRIVVRDEQLRLTRPGVVKLEGLFRTASAGEPSIGEQTSEMLRSVTDIVDHIVDRVRHEDDSSSPANP
jgi:hypothetical protein